MLFQVKDIRGYGYHLHYYYHVIIIIISIVLMILINDLTTMLGEVSSNENNGQVAGIHRSIN